VINQDTKDKISLIIKLSREIQKVDECSGVCDSGGICSFCTIKLFLDDISDCDEINPLED